MTQTNHKTQIFNLVILDKSGSMNFIAEAAISGFNETVVGIREAQEKFKETQEHFVSLLVFCSCERRLIYDKVPVNEIGVLTAKDYRPCCSTPLYDAMGFSLNELLKDIKDKEDATAVVTVITDGMENSSREYSAQAIKALVESLKENEGWTFSYIGTNQDVETVSQSLSIDFSMHFEDSNEGMQAAWESERNAKMRHYDRMNDTHAMMGCMAASDRKKARAAQNKASEWYGNINEIKDRITPEQITTLAPNEIFVFGSNIVGHHTGGAANFAVQHFGAVQGQAEGLQGQSYAIPTKGVSAAELRDSIDRFIQFALDHPDKTFLVTKIGCGIAGHSISEMSGLFRYAQKATNIHLPIEFWYNIL